MTYTTEAIALKYRIYREYDRIYTVYTKEYGKLSLLARGANKITSKLAGHLEPCCFSSLMIAGGRGREVLAQARTRISFVFLRQEPLRFIAAQGMLEPLDALTHTHEADTRVFRLLLSGFKRLQSSKSLNYLSFVYHYLLRLLVYLGHAPDIKHKQELYQFLVADIGMDGIMVGDTARRLIDTYLRSALDEKRLNSLDSLKLKVQ